MLYKFKFGTHAVHTAQKIYHAFGEDCVNTYTTQKQFKKFAANQRVKHNPLTER